MTITEKVETFVKGVFKTSLDVFLEALKLSPNAQGYMLGSVTELLLKQHLETNGFETLRIREKWEGTKHPNHHGDFYFRKPKEDWFVLESKGVKSNSEKWHKLYNYEKLVKFLVAHHDKIGWIDVEKDIQAQVKAWIAKHLPRFLTDFSSTLYDFEEIKKYEMPPKETAKSKAIAPLKGLSREEIGNKIQERLDYLMSKVKVLETHFVAQKSEKNARTQATPRIDEFNLISINIFLRFSEHYFLFANPLQLAPSQSDKNHLQQNYIMGFVFNENGSEELHLDSIWSNDLVELFKTLDKTKAVKKDDMQIDVRK